MQFPFFNSYILSDSGFCLLVHSYNKRFQHSGNTYHINLQNIRFLKEHILLENILHSLWSLAFSVITADIKT